MNKKIEHHPLFNILLALVLFLFLRWMIIDIKKVEGHSMEPTIHPGEFVLIFKLAYGFSLPFGHHYLFLWRTPQAGDIIAAVQPLDQKIIIKRVAAAAGTTFLLEEDRLVIAGKEIPAAGNNLLKTLSSSRVPADKTLLIGDNYRNSVDSRTFGFLSNRKILGKVLRL